MASSSMQSSLLSLVIVLSSLCCSSALQSFSDCTSSFGPLSPSNQSVFVQWYNNTAFAPTSTSHLYQTNSSFAYSPSLTFSFPTSLPPLFPSSPSSFSFQVHGHLLVPRSGLYSFQCSYDPSQLTTLLWIDDHLLCPTDANNVNQSIHATASQLLHLRLEAVQRQPYSAQLYPHLDIRWQLDNATFQPIPSTVLTACLSPPRLQQMALHSRQLQTGWDALYNPDLMTSTLLPHGLGLQLAVYRISTGEFRGNFTTERAINGSSTTTLFRILNRTWTGDAQPYLSYGLAWAGMNVTVEMTSDRSDNSLTLVVAGESASNGNWSDYRLILFPLHIWGRVGQCSLNPKAAAGTPFTVCRSEGISPDVPFYSTMPVDGQHYAGINETIYGDQFLGFRFPQQSRPTVVLSAVVRREVKEAQSLVAQAVKAPSVYECVDAGLVEYGVAPAPLEQCNLIQTTLAWLATYTPYEGIVLVVSRRWDFGFGYVLFEWDSFFSVVMLSSLRSPLAKELLLSTFLQVVKTRTITPDGLGFIPNYASGTIASRDRTEPPIAAKVLLELTRAFGADDADLQWLVPLCYEDIWRETSWFWYHRRLAPVGLISLGSDPNPPIFGDIEYNDMQAARYESGLDNSPMYDDDGLFNNQTHLMQLYDVGMTSLFIAACRSLLQLSNITGVGLEYSADLTAKADEMGKLAEQLWDDRQGLYVNVRAKDGEFSRRLSPTSFFPLIAGLPSVAQAEVMVLQHLQNPDEFCVGLDCQGQPLPSIARSDLNYTDQSYWRGRQWGPHTMLVWWGLTEERYAGSGVVRAARVQLARQVDEIWKGEWRAFHHVHENYDGDSAVGCNTGNSDPLYSWGALNPYVAILQWVADAQANKARVEASAGEGVEEGVRVGVEREVDTVETAVPLTGLSRLREVLKDSHRHARQMLQE